MTELQAEILVALAKNQLSVSETARKLYMHRTTVNYHIRQIRKLTGKNPLDFYDMCELLPQARKILYHETELTDQTRNALVEIGRKSHGESDA